MASTTATSLAVTVAHAIAYITRPLIVCYPVATLLKLQLALEVHLTKHYIASWVPSEPLRGSGRRCLSFSPSALPPRPIYAALRAANVQWSEWSAALGNLEFDLFVDPGCVSVRVGAGQLYTVWSDELESAAQAKAAAARRTQETARAILKPASLKPTSKAFMQELKQADAESEDELFAALADEIRDPTFVTPVAPTFPAIAAPERPSSRSSTSSGSATSLFSDSDATSVSSATSASTTATKLSRRERARLARVFVDTSKRVITEYDGGKTAVLTGGVMLGGKPKPTAAFAPKAPRACAAGSWRPVRA